MDRVLGSGSRADALGRHDNEQWSLRFDQIGICSSSAGIGIRKWMEQDGGVNSWRVFPPPSSCRRHAFGIGGGASGGATSAEEGAELLGHGLRRLLGQVVAAVDGAARHLGRA